MSTDGRKRLETALAATRALFPHVAATLAGLDVRLDDRVETACVCPSGRMLFSPAFLRKLTLQQTVFVVAHELYHILYGVFDRLEEGMPADRRKLVNVAHDFIINDMLVQKFRDESRSLLERDLDGDELWEHDLVGAVADSFIPEEGLFWAKFRRDYERLTGRPQPPIESYTLESLVLDLESCRSMLPEMTMLQAMAGRQESPVTDSEDSPGTWGGAFDDLPGMSPQGDEGPEDGRDGTLPSPVEEARTGAQDELLTSEQERTLFPDESEVERHQRREALTEIQENENLCRCMVDSLDERGAGGGASGSRLVEALMGRFATPWEDMLQKWIDDSAPPPRSWAHASRRAGNRTDVVLPGRARDGYIIHIVLDTSGSMTEVLPAALGMIQAFGRASGVRAAHVIQCDSDVTSDEIVEIDELGAHEIKWETGGGMDEYGMLRMAADPDVESVLVITDGWIRIPSPEQIPYDVLWWILSPDGDTSHFNPGYGRVVGAPIGEFLPPSL